MDLKVVDIFIQVVVFLFAISVHESAHGWMADRCGDPTAKMLGRITLNPIKHIDPVGSILLPLVGLVTFGGIFGWAKPTPVTPENFRHKVNGDIYTTLAGPASNILIVFVSMVFLTLIAHGTGSGRELVHNIALGALTDTDSLWMPIVWLLYSAVHINILLFVFNLIPVPPLDGSHVLRHMLPNNIRNIYDSIGMIGIFVLFIFGGPLINALMRPFMNLARLVLLKL